jgi:DNA-directed RNA polymerase specialized sigma24 family protein
LKKKEGNVRVILHRALVKLRNILEKDKERRGL